MTRFLVPALFATAAAVPALAAPVVSHAQFSRDGIDYVATVSTEGSTQKIEGYEVKSGLPFTLRVAGGSVTGDYNGAPVSFRAPAADGDLVTASR